MFGSPNRRSIPVAQGAAGTTALLPAVANRKIVVYGFTLTMSAAGTMKFQSASNDLCGAMPIDINAGLVQPHEVKPCFETNTNEALNLVTTVGAAKGWLIYEYAEA